MPHSEYVSGSACLFQGTEDFVNEYLELIGMDSTFPVLFDTFVAGSSKVESGVIPAEDIVLAYPDIGTMATVGSQSRLDGGMHFAESVPAGKDLCKGIGQYEAEAIVDLYQ